MYPDDESTEEHPDNFYLDESDEEEEQGSSFGKGCLIIMAVIMILSLLLRYLH